MQKVDSAMMQQYSAELKSWNQWGPDDKPVSLLTPFNPNAGFLKMRRPDFYTPQTAASVPCRHALKSKSSWSLHRRSRKRQVQGD